MSSLTKYCDPCRFPGLVLTATTRDAARFKGTKSKSQPLVEAGEDRVSDFWADLKMEAATTARFRIFQGKSKDKSKSSFEKIKKKHRTNL